MAITQRSASEFKAGDKCITKYGDVVTVNRVTGGRYVEIVEDLDIKIYIPSHGDIGKVA